MNKLDDLFERTRLYKGSESNRRFMPLIPICIQVTGIDWKRVTKGLDKPFDTRMRDLMWIVTEAIVKETNACIGYIQSNEINLIYYNDDLKGQIFFDRKIMKMISVISSVTTATFNRYLPEVIPEKAHRVAVFSCKAWGVPTLEEAANIILWEETVAIEKSISIAARQYYSHKQLLGKNEEDRLAMLLEKDMDWKNDYPVSFQRGTFFQRRKVSKKFNKEEITDLPPKHIARKDPDLKFERTEVRRLDMPPFSEVINRVGVIFNGEDPIVDTK